MPEMGAGILSCERVPKGGPGCDGALGDHGDTIHVRRTVHVLAVPVDAASFTGQPILDVNYDDISFAHLKCIDR